MSFDIFTSTFLQSGPKTCWHFSRVNLVPVFSPPAGMGFIGRMGHMGRMKLRSFNEIRFPSRVLQRGCSVDEPAQQIFVNAAFEANFAVEFDHGDQQIKLRPKFGIVVDVDHLGDG